METKEQKEQYEHKTADKYFDTSDKGITRPDIESGEIDLIELIKKVWAERKIIYISVVIFFLLGVFFALVSPEEYTAKIVLMPQSANSSSSNLASGVLRQFGISGLGSSGSGSALNVMLYPEITSSSEFCLDLMEKSFYFSELDTTVTLLTYFSDIESIPITDKVKNYTLGLPKLIIKFPINLIKKWNSTSPVQQSNFQKALQEDSILQRTATATDSGKASPSILKEYEPVHISNKQLAVVNELRQRVTTIIQPNGMLEVSSKMPDPLVAAKSTELAVRYLTSYIKDYQIEKIKEDLDFIEKQYIEKQARYNQSQQKLARLRDRNSNLVTESARIELERAQTEFNLAFNLYQSVAQQLEQARIKVQEETPSFKVLEPLQIPNSKSEPNEELIIFLFLFVGVVISFSIIIIKILYNQFKHKFH